MRRVAVVRGLLSSSWEPGSLFRITDFLASPNRTLITEQDHHNATYNVNDKPDYPRCHPRVNLAQLGHKTCERDHACDLSPGGGGVLSKYSLSGHLQTSPGDARDGNCYRDCVISAIISRSVRARVVLSWLGHHCLYSIYMHMQTGLEVGMGSEGGHWGLNEYAIIRRESGV